MLCWNQADYYLLEGMGCPGGCVAGAGTIRAVRETTAEVERFKKRADKVTSLDSEYLDWLHKVVEE